MCVCVCFCVSLCVRLSQGKEQNKPETSALHIQNPFEPTLNVSKNVNAAQLGRMVTLCQEAAWILQQQEFSAPPAARDAGPSGGHATWGLAALLLPSDQAGRTTKGRQKKRMEPASARIKSLLESLKSPAQKKKS